MRPASTQVGGSELTPKASGAFEENVYVATPIPTHLQTITRWSKSRPATPLLDRIGHEKGVDRVRKLENNEALWALEPDPTMGAANHRDELRLPYHGLAQRVCYCKAESALRIVIRRCYYEYAAFAYLD